jgi:DNA-binding transcriptional MerR regulator
MLDISNVIAAFSEEQVEKITGLTKARLRYWDRTGFFKPSYTEDNPRAPFSRFYSFKDIVALRTLELLRVQNGVSLQQLRKVAERLSHLKDDLWTKTTLYVANRKVVVVNSETDRHEEVVSGQYVLPVHLKKIMQETSQNIEEMRRRPAEQIGRVERHRAICHNAWVVAGTRIPIGAIKRLHEDGFSVNQIIAEYPDLTPADVEAALSHEVGMAA